MRRDGCVAIPKGDDVIRRGVATASRSATTGATMNRYAIHTLRCAACSTTPSSAAGPTLVKAEASRRSGV